MEIWTFSFSTDGSTFRIWMYVLLGEYQVYIVVDADTCDVMD